MPLHPHIAQVLQAAQGAPAYHQVPIAQARELAARAYRSNAEPLQVGQVRNLSMDGPAGPIALRLYTPRGKGPHPLLVFFHGSGFVMLGLDSHDDICRRLCAGTHCVVVSVDYRLAPEHRFPAAPDDCVAATRWIAAHCHHFDADSTRMAVAGDSAGGCLAAVTAIRLRDEGGPALAAQLLVYPVTDYPSVPSESYRAFGSGYGLTHEAMQWFWRHYLPDAAAAAHPHASPMRVLSAAGLPAAYVLVAEYDVLRDEGEAFAQRLAQTGVETISLRCEGMNHGFLKYAGSIAQVDEALQAACAWLGQRLRVRPAKAD